MSMRPRPCDVHPWIHKKTPSDENGGYMTIKFCPVCYETEGFGFLDKQHEINYLEALYNDDL